MQMDTTTFDGACAAVQALLPEAESPSGDLAAFEEQLMSNLMAVGRALMKVRLEGLSPESEFIEGGARWRVAVQSRIPVMTSFGTVEVERPLFRSGRTGPTRCLVKERAPLMAGFWTERAASLAAWAVAEMPMQQAETLFGRIGTMPVSRSSLLRLVGGLSDMWEEERERHEAAVRAAVKVPDEAKVVAVSLDGVMVLLTDSDKAVKKAKAKAKGHADNGPAGCKEASVGVISFYDAEGERLETRRYGRMPEADKVTTKAWLEAELRHVCAARPDLKVLAIADGAANNWTFLSELGADHEVVDFYHTAEHLHRHVSKANGASTIETQEKLKAMRRDLLEVPGAAEKVFEDMKKMREKAGTAPVSTTKKRGKRQPTFFERHHMRMAFAELREANIPIGSGVTESTCKLTVCDRLRRTGMRWKERGGQAVLTLRAHQVSDRFDTAWSILAETNRQRCAA